MIIYLDNDYKCHLDNDGTMLAYEVYFFEGRCKDFIEGYRVVPAGETWTRDDGVVFYGEMVSPWVDIRLLDAAQSEYERQLMEDMRRALEIMEVTV